MMNAVVKPYHEMCLNSSELIVPRDTYQRALHPARVARIAKEFDERVANEPKISFRDGHYYVIDGQNTIAARKFLNGGEDLQIRCKVYFGMTLWHTVYQAPYIVHPAACRGHCPHRFCKSVFPVLRLSFGQQPDACAFSLYRHSVGQPAFPERRE